MLNTVDSDLLSVVICLPDSLKELEKLLEVSLQLGIRNGNKWNIEERRFMCIYCLILHLIIYLFCHVRIDLVYTNSWKHLVTINTRHVIVGSPSSENHP